MKIKESELKKIIKEALLEYKETYGGNADNVYIRPNGKTSIDTTELPGEHKFNIHFNGHNFDSMKRSISNSDSLYSKGKAKLCFQISSYLEDLFGINVWGEQEGKIDWTPAELEQIKKIQTEIRNLASMSKTESAKQRHGVTDDKLAAMIRENISKVLGELK